MRPLWLALLGLTALVVGASAQQAVFRTTTQFVSVDVVVTDSNDAPVRDLTKDDFEIAQNGRPQTISEFSFLSVPLANRTVDVDAAPLPPSDVGSNGDTARASRAIVVLVDDSSLSAVLTCLDCPDVMVSLKKALTQFLQSLTPDDQVALVWQSRSDLSTDFTNDIPRLIASVNSRKKAMGLTPIGPPWRPRVDSLKFAIDALANSHVARRSIVFVGVEACSPIDMSSFQGVECRDMYQKARQANVPIYALDPRVNPPGGSDSLAELAVNTGGRHFMQQSRPLWAVDQILTDTGSFYLLGFYPEPAVNDGKYHDIAVTVKRPGLRVRARDRYLADAATKPPSTPNRDMTAALSAGVDNPGLPIRAVASPLEPLPRGGTKTLVTIELTYPTPTDGRMALDDELRVGIVALSPDAKIKASFQRPVTFTGKWKPTARGTFIINETIDLPSDPLTLRVGVTSRALGKTGTAHLAVDVPNYRGSNLTLSPLVLLGSPVGADAATNLDLVRSLVPALPTTTRHFAPAATVRVFARAFWGGGDTSLPVELTVSDPAGPRTIPTTVAADVRELGKRRVDIDIALPLKGLSAGPHVLTLTAHVGKGKAVTRAIPITID